MPKFTPLRPPGRMLLPSLVGVLALQAALPAQAACADTLLIPNPSNSTHGQSATTSMGEDASAPRVKLLSLVQAAAERSKAVGAARLLADAADGDAESARANTEPQLSFSASALPLNGQTGGTTTATKKNQFQLRPTLTLSGPLYDAGRIGHQTRWREQLAEAARQGQLTVQEQVALQTVSLSFDRSRYRLQTQVWQQYAVRVCQLVDSLEQIVATDKGRGSELIQARKTLQQVLLSRAQAQTQLKITETRLRRLVNPPSTAPSTDSNGSGTGTGSGSLSWNSLPPLPEPTGLSALMLQPPELGTLMDRAADAPNIAQLAAQANAAQSQADATEAGQQLQANWQLSAGKNLTGDKNGYWNGGLTLSIPLFNPGAAPVAKSARQRAEAARLQRLDALEALQARLAEAHAQAHAAVQRARDVAQVVKSSERVRDDTVQQWQQLGKRSLFDVMSAEGDFFNLRLAYVDALHDGQQAVALLWSLAGGVEAPLH